MVVNETLNNKLENTTDFVREFFGFVNTVFEPVNIEITIADIMVENEDGVGLLPFIYKFNNPEMLGVSFDIGGVSLPIMASWKDRGRSSFDIVVALTGLSVCKDVGETNSFGHVPSFDCVKFFFDIPFTSLVFLEAFHPKPFCVTHYCTNILYILILWVGGL